MKTSLFQRTRFVLVETSHPGNIGSTARAIKTMGFARLVLVAPACAAEGDPRRDPSAVAMASGASDVLDAALIVGTLDEALADATRTYALTARQREFGPPRMSPREACAALAAESGAGEAGPGGEIAFVFGNERVGLSNEDVERCGAALHIPANPDYASLNLSQAVQLVAYEARLAALASQGEPQSWPVQSGFRGEAASHAQIEQAMQHLEQALEAIGFLDPRAPGKLMPRLRRLFARSKLEVEEVNILRGIAKAMLGRAR